MAPAPTGGRRRTDALRPPPQAWGRTATPRPRPARPVAGRDLSALARPGLGAARQRGGGDRGVAVHPRRRPRQVANALPDPGTARNHERALASHSPTDSAVALTPIRA